MEFPSQHHGSAVSCVQEMEQGQTAWRGYSGDWRQFYIRILVLFYFNNIERLFVPLFSGNNTLHTNNQLWPRTVTSKIQSSSTPATTQNNTTQHTTFEEILSPYRFFFLSPGWKHLHSQTYPKPNRFVLIPIVCMYVECTRTRLLEIARCRQAEMAGNNH